jgi:hypothetical protein
VYVGNKIVAEDQYFSIQDGGAVCAKDGKHIPAPCLFR